MRLNKQLLLGRVGRKGAELRYNATGTPTCVVETNKPGADGQVYTSFHKVDITGRFAEDLSVTLEPGDEILVEGEHPYRSTVDPKTPQKKTARGLSTWGVEPAHPSPCGRRARRGHARSRPGRTGGEDHRPERTCGRQSVAARTVAALRL